MSDQKITADFTESKIQQPKTDPKALLSRRINELALKIQGTELENLILQLYRELNVKGIAFKPKCYLSDEWGCPHGIPIIGIPFYLADPNLKKIEAELTGIETENKDEIIMYLRHEAGHAFNYAHKIYRKRLWRSTFGKFSTPYREIYKPKPFSPSFVRNIPGWYGQKHPDEDFAETFAVFLTPNSNWRVKYQNTPALKKLLFVEEAVKQYGRLTPVIKKEILDTPLEELSDTLKEWYTVYPNGLSRKLKLPKIISEDLKNLFTIYNKDLKQIRADQFIRENSRTVSKAINTWTGIEMEVIDLLLEKILKRVKKLKLFVNIDSKEQTLTNFCTFATTLVVNYLYKGNFVML